MSWRTNGLVLVARSLGRALGVNRRLARVLHGSGYETQYDQAFAAQLRRGDCVWDVGANVGHYTRLFSERVGSAGAVFAFEPSSVNFLRLCEACADLDQAKLLPFGLGREDARLTFEQGADDLGATSRVIEAGGGVTVDIRSGASLIRAGDAAPPDAIKIDVEGFESEVLEGLGEYLGRPSLRTVGVEVHFGILKARGLADAPRRIENLLQEHGFTVRWPDSSHILAVRRRT